MHDYSGADMQAREAEDRLVESRALVERLARDIDRVSRERDKALAEVERLRDHARILAAQVDEARAERDAALAVAGFGRAGSAQSVQSSGN